LEVYKVVKNRKWYILGEWIYLSQYGLVQ